MRLQKSDIDPRPREPGDVQNPPAPPFFKGGASPVPPFTKGGTGGISFLRRGAETPESH